MTPSVKTISTRLQDVLEKEYSKELIPSIVKEIRNVMLNANLLRDHHAVDTALDIINGLLHGYGVEAIRGTHHVGPYYLDINLLYVNLGDTYVPTVLFDTLNHNFLIGSWGDFVEAHPKRFDL